MPSNPQFIRLAVALNLAEGDGAPLWVPVLPAGPFLTGADGRGWKMSNPAALIAALNAVTVDRPIDINHSTELLGPKGEESPAVGWLKAGTFRIAANGQIEAQAEWTPRGKAIIEAREYRYVSPAIAYSRADNEVKGLFSLGLVPRPNFTELPALNSQTDSLMTKEQLTALCAALGLAADAAPDTIIASAAKLKADHATALNAATHPDLAKFVPKADYDVALNRATAAEQKLADQNKIALNAAATALIDGAVKDGKIAPASKEFYLGLCASQEGLDKVKAHLASAPKIIADGETAATKPADQGTALNAAALEVAAAFGNSADDLKKNL